MTRNQEPPEWVFAKEIARRTGLSLKTVYRMERVGRMPPAVKVTKPYRWPRGKAERWIKDFLDSLSRP